MTKRKQSTCTGYVSGEESHNGTPLLTIDQLQQLVHLIDHSDICEVEVKIPGTQSRLLLRKAQPGSDDRDAVESLPFTTDTPISNETNDETEYYTVTAPCVGLFQPWPGAKNRYSVAPGDSVQEGQPLCIVSSMGIANEIEAPLTGHIVEILTQYGQPVEYGQALLTMARQ